MGSYSPQERALAIKEGLGKDADSNERLLAEMLLERQEEFARYAALVEAAEMLLQTLRDRATNNPTLMYTTPGWLELQKAIKRDGKVG